MLTGDRTEHLDHARELISLEGNSAFLRTGVDLGFFTFEHGSESEELAVDAADGPNIDRRRVVPCAEKQFGRTIPNCDDDLDGSRHQQSCTCF